MECDVIDQSTEWNIKKGGRGDWTRTSGLHVPNVARYQLRYTPTLCCNATLSVPNVARYQLRYTPQHPL